MAMFQSEYSDILELTKKLTREELDEFASWLREQERALYALGEAATKRCADEKRRRRQAFEAMAVEQISKALSDSDVHGEEVYRSGMDKTRGDYEIDEHLCQVFFEKELTKMYEDFRDAACHKIKDLKVLASQRNEQ